MKNDSKDGDESTPERSDSSSMKYVCNAFVIIGMEMENKEQG